MPHPERPPVPSAAHQLPHRLTPPFDAAGVLALILDSFAYMEGRIDPPSSMQQMSVEGIEDLTRMGELWAIGTPPLACIALTPRADALYLGRLAVHAACRGQGLARRLVTLAEDRARAMGLGALELSVRIELVENHATFRALGFQEVSRSAHPGFDRPTSLNFRKQL